MEGDKKLVGRLCRGVFGWWGKSVVAGRTGQADQERRKIGGIKKGHKKEKEVTGLGKMKVWRYVKRRIQVVKVAVVNKVVVGGEDMGLIISSGNF